MKGKVVHGQACNRDEGQPCSCKSYGCRAKPWHPSLDDESWSIEQDGEGPKTHKTKNPRKGGSKKQGTCGNKQQTRDVQGDVDVLAVALLLPRRDSFRALTRGKHRVELPLLWRRSHISLRNRRTAVRRRHTSWRHDPRGLLKRRRHDRGLERHWLPYCGRLLYCCR